MLGNIEKLLVYLRDSRLFLYTQSGAAVEHGAADSRYVVARFLTHLGELRGDSEDRGLDFELAIERLESAAKERFLVKEFSGGRQSVFELCAKRVFTENNCVNAQCAFLGFVGTVPHFYCAVTAFNKHENPPATTGRNLDETLFNALEEAEAFFLRSA